MSHYKIIIDAKYDLKIVELDYTSEENDYNLFSKTSYYEIEEAQSLIDDIYRWLGQRYLHRNENNGTTKED